MNQFLRPIQYRSLSLFLNISQRKTFILAFEPLPSEMSGFEHTILLPCKDTNRVRIVIFRVLHKACQRYKVVLAPEIQLKTSIYVRRIQCRDLQCI